VRSVQGIEVVLTTRRFFLPLCRVRGIVVDCFTECDVYVVSIVLGGTVRGPFDTGSVTVTD
jgi:hypothetical protein